MIRVPVRGQDGAIVAHAQVDHEDVWVALSVWHLHDGYPCRELADGSHQGMHKAIKGSRTVYIEGTLDNRRANLRPRALRVRQNDDRALPRGVYGTRNSMYQAKVGKHYLGTFATVQEAEEAADKARAKRGLE